MNMKKTTRRRQPPAANGSITETPPAEPLSREAIERRAYEIYLARGRNGGDPQADWLQAEQELLQKH
jgi:Protein of unknown function (DUF2934)